MGDLIPFQNRDVLTKAQIYIAARELLAKAGGDRASAALSLFAHLADRRVEKTGLVYALLEDHVDESIALMRAIVERAAAGD